jgi:hypothetical protein
MGGVTCGGTGGDAMASLGTLGGAVCAMGGTGTLRGGAVSRGSSGVARGGTGTLRTGD